MATTLENFARHGIAWKKGEPVPQGEFEPDEFAELESLGLIGSKKNFPLNPPKPISLKSPSRSGTKKGKESK